MAFLCGLSLDTFYSVVAYLLQHCIWPLLSLSYVKKFTPMLQDMVPSNFFSNYPLSFFQSTALHLDPTGPLYVIFHFEKGCKFSLHHLAQFPLFFCGRDLQTPVLPAPALVSLAHLGVGIPTCRINELKGAVFAVLPTCGCCFEVLC